ncbi:basic phospholipase A2 RVV-VD-like [Tubulanus polymorphus]|uniref:basic phospholipase A2 RVV-VD-like n=1 Tax=Tubulanus polymorphus TaxID=672921 RepID=UPI003DA1CCD0
MKILFVVLFILELKRSHQDIAQFADLVRKTTGMNPFLFVDYGNWCGIGGSGEVEDQIDSCCRDHDNCWAELEKSKCKNNLLLWVTYNYRRVAAKQFKCYPTLWMSSCTEALCQCDVDAANCLRKWKHVYDKTFKN